MSYQTLTVSKTSQQPVSLQQAKEHLRIVNDDLDEVIQLAIDSAVEYCEAALSRPLRVNATMRQTYPHWPTCWGGTGVVRFDLEPVIEITSVTYFDVDDVSQTLASSNYRLLKSTLGASLFEFIDDLVFPSLATRADAVAINYTAGYEQLEDVPRLAKSAILLQTELNFGNLDSRMIQHKENAVKNSLALLQRGLYR